MGVLRRKLGKVRRILFQPEAKWDIVDMEDQFDFFSKGIENYQLKTIIDIGANEGQFAEKMRKKYPSAQLYSFEPIPEVYERLKQNFVKDDNFTAYNLALGNSSGETTFNLNEQPVSSSLLKMTEHKSHFDFANKETVISIKIEKLNNITFSKPIQKPLLIKLDVQGYEMEVIEGGEDVIKEADIIISEVSYKSLYEGQPLFDDIYRKMIQLGFEFAGNAEQLYSPKTGEILQADAIFVKSKLKNN